MMRVLGARRLNDKDCAVSIEVAGSRYELVAERIWEPEEGMGLALGDFSPSRVFADLPLSARQVRELVRAAVLTHRGERLTFPLEVPE
ncbi:hypothetical protein [Myxococcus qinghaiensis]|uniref:hypothetical protein n=1 Tax=Myxococcus qinghaiensis TaxID=2906758 RepID=UPI0020A7AFE1|nr:hypothetical protein [Myxococcus qinghaiensis]MCP3165358.1 hypothetical protein [Myxococcus qinghaiensis]